MLRSASGKSQGNSEFMRYVEYAKPICTHLLKKRWVPASLLFAKGHLLAVEEMGFAHFAEAGGGGFGGEVALRGREEFVADHEFANRGRA